MTNAGRPVILIHRGLACELVIRQSVQGSGLEKQCRFAKCRSPEVLSTSKGACSATRIRIPGRTAGIVVCPEMEGLCVFEPVCRWGRFHCFAEQQLTLESCAGKTQEEVRVLSSPGHSHQAGGPDPGLTTPKGHLKFPPRSGLVQDD